MFVANVIVGIPANLESDSSITKPPIIPGTYNEYDSV